MKDYVLITLLGLVISLMCFLLVSIINKYNTLIPQKSTFKESLWFFVSVKNMLNYKDSYCYTGTNVRLNLYLSSIIKTNKKHTL